MRLAPAARTLSGERPTRVRWRILALVTLLSMLTYLDRLNLSIAGRNIQAEFGLTNDTMGWIFSAFVLGYALFQIPGGWVGDRYGPRGMLTLTILGWSMLTAATALAPRLPPAAWFGVAFSFAVIRFAIGAGEASAMPNANKIVGNWISTARRGIGSSSSLIGIGVGGALTPPLIAWVMQHHGWRSSFYLCGVIGVAFAIAWHMLVTSRPEQHRNINRAELDLIRSSQAKGKQDASPGRNHPPWARMLSSLSVWGLILGYFCQGYPIYFFHTWFFMYLVRVRGFSLTQGGWWDATPYLAIGLLAPLGGWFSDLATSKIGKRRGRQVSVWIGMGLSAALMWAGANSPSPYVAVLLLAAGGGLNMFAATSFWATCIDLTENYVASLTALMNTFGNLGGWLSPIVTAYIATRFGWNLALDCTALVTVCSGLLWIFVDASKRLDEGLAASYA